MYTTTQIIKLVSEGNLQAFYNERFWRKFSKKIIQEQHGECQKCKQRGKYSKAKILHHVKHLRQYPELAYSRFYFDKQGVKHRQLIALCQMCHEEEHPDRARKKKRNMFQNEERW